MIHIVRFCFNLILFDMVFCFPCMIQLAKAKPSLLQPAMAEVVAMHIISSIKAHHHAVQERWWWRTLHRPPSRGGGRCRHSCISSISRGWWICTRCWSRSRRLPSGCGDCVWCRRGRIPSRPTPKAEDARCLLRTGGGIFVGFILDEDMTLKRRWSWVDVIYCETRG